MPTACFAFNYCGVVVIAGRTLQPSVLCRRQPLSLGSIFKGECCFDGSCWLCKHTTLFPFTSFDHLYDVGFDSVILTKCFHYVACIHCWHQWLSWWAGNKLSVFERCRPPSVLDLQKPSDPHSRKEPRCHVSHKWDKSGMWAPCQQLTLSYRQGAHRQFVVKAHAYAIIIYLTSNSQNLTLTNIVTSLQQSNAVCTKEEKNEGLSFTLMSSSVT